MQLPSSHCTVCFSLLSSVTGSFLKSQDTLALHLMHGPKQIDLDPSISALLLDTHTNYNSPRQHIIISSATAPDAPDASQKGSPETKNAGGTDDAKPSTSNASILQSQILTDCPEEDEEPWCHECGEGDFDPKSGVFRCRGIAEENYKWKGCDCIQKSGHIVHRAEEGEVPSDERIGEILDGLPDWTEASYSKNPDDWAKKDEDEDEEEDEGGKEPGKQI